MNLGCRNGGAYHGPRRLQKPPFPGLTAAPGTLLFPQTIPLPALARASVTCPLGDTVAWQSGKAVVIIHLTGPPHAAGTEKLMSGVSLILNLLWIVFGGLWMALGWAIAALIMAVTIVGLPWTWSALTIASYTLLPFGHRVVPRSSVTGHEDIGTGPLGLIGNLIWLLLAGWWLALGHLITAALLAITIIGIPFAWAHLKLARLALWPIGKMVVPA
jgi:uncharacterized membrane protein YccF (DUF307 family)